MFAKAFRVKSNTVIKGSDRLVFTASNYICLNQNILRTQDLFEMMMVYIITLII